MTSKLSGIQPPDPRRLSMDALTASLAAIGTLVALATAWVVIDYNEWVSFGTGGTPPTPSGYWRMTKFRWRMFTSSDNLRDASKIPDEGPKYLTDLPQRKGHRPSIIARTMPQRQKPEPLDPAARERLQSIPATLCTSHSDILKLDLSKTEGRSTQAIYALPSLPGRDPGAKDRMLGDEIAHVHPADNSLHVWLSPRDAREVVEKGWGERFPLSSLGMLHPSWVMVYAPRDSGEVEGVEGIVRAGVGFLTGVRV